MKTTRRIILLLGTVSAVCLLVCIAASSITVLPEAEQALGLVVKTTFFTAFLAAIINVTLAFQAVSLAFGNDEAAARETRRLGLWLSLPQMLVILVLALGTLVWIGHALRSGG